MPVFPALPVSVFLSLSGYASDTRVLHLRIRSKNPRRDGDAQYTKSFLKHWPSRCFLVERLSSSWHRFTLVLGPLDTSDWHTLTSIARVAKLNQIREDAQDTHIAHRVTTTLQTSGKPNLRSSSPAPSVLNPLLLVGWISSTRTPPSTLIGTTSLSVGAGPAGGGTDTPALKSTLRKNCELLDS